MELWNTPPYRRWYNIKSRCENPKNDKYHLYGGRGIKVCERWQNFHNFYADMGDPPSPRHSVDRVDNNGPYSPENCRWATVTEQNRNKRNNRVILGKCMSEWAEQLGVTPETISARVNSEGMTYEEAVMAPKRRKQNYKVPILQKDKDGSVIARHLSLREAGECVYGDRYKTATHAILRVLNGERRSYLGYCWEYDR